MGKFSRTDDSAKPVISLLAFQEDRAVGHIMFSRVTLEPNVPLSISILGPLAVMPDVQKQGIGSKLIQKGLEILSTSGVDLVFVLGHPTYYPRFGFKPAGELGFEPTYPILEKNADAWMVQELRPGIIGSFSGRIICADSLDDPRHWQE
ncbi:GNAT family N-acetyltransferase [Okeania sp. KiyG1]|uniref:GNAT family N-acetyltransferase n=1 Tax=Okeania sp. KiyG1 TaxID=2720165 RepID=UPI0019233C58|nr:N-acetyltransferase [Okeania sp. KiyG1]GFZ93993.1 hypothetical protein CYANOKiyG1_04630 [Okeania sp. KiyG1]